MPSTRARDPRTSPPPRQLAVILGDQLTLDHPALARLDRRHDWIWMAETPGEATHVWSSRLRLIYFFTTMRHYRDALRADGWTVRYHALSPDATEDQGHDLRDLLARDIDAHHPQQVLLMAPGDWRVRQMFVDLQASTTCPFTWLEDDHFFSSGDDFQQWAQGRKTLVMDHFYRRQRQTHRVLLTGEGKPVGGRWNFDQDNRAAFGRKGPPLPVAPPRFSPDDLTRQVSAMVQARFADHPGPPDPLARWDLPVTRPQALQLLDWFIEHALPDFGRYQDAMWVDQPLLFHSRLSAALNSHLLNAREVVERAVGAWHAQAAPLNSVEGFVRQILGWREFVRGIYWQYMPEYAQLNALGCDPDTDVPESFWHGRTDMRCVAQCMGQVIEMGYAHHIQRLMVLGLYAQLLGVHPLRFHQWHMAMYLDAIDWVSLPNTLGMSQFGDGGLMATKPYCASGQYIRRMSNYCQGCRYKPEQAVGPDACPVTTLYWDFLDRHREQLSGNHRMGFQLKNLQRKEADWLAAVRHQAAALRSSVAGRKARGV